MFHIESPWPSRFSAGRIGCRVVVSEHNIIAESNGAVRTSGRPAFNVKNRGCITNDRVVVDPRVSIISETESDGIVGAAVVAQVCVVGFRHAWHWRGQPEAVA